MKVIPYNASTSESSFIYRFISTGVKGKIEKIVKFEEIDLLSGRTYNVALGDFDSQTGFTNFEDDSGNLDVRKVFATVGHIIRDFLENHPDCSVYIEGNKKKKTIAYGIAIKSFLEAINLGEYEINGVEGYSDKFINKVEYDPSKNDYLAFIIKKKTLKD